MRLRIFDCFRKNAFPLALKEHNWPENQEDAPVISREPGNDQLVLQALQQIQAALLDLDGSWLSRMEGLQREFVLRGLAAELYICNGISTVDPVEFLLLSPGSAGPRPSQPDDEQMLLLHRMASLQAPVTQYGSCNQEPNHKQSRTAAALPLLQGGNLIGALWLEEFEQSKAPVLRKQTQHQERLQKQPSAEGLAEASGSFPTACPSPDPLFKRTVSRNVGQGAQQCAVLLRQRESDDALRQLAFTTSMCLVGSGSDTLAWLAGVVRRLRAASTMHDLTAQLCSSLEAHVRRQFMLEAHAVAALAPPGPNAQRAMLFRVLQQHHQRGGAGAGNTPPSMTTGSSRHPPETSDAQGFSAGSFRSGNASSGARRLQQCNPMQQAAWDSAPIRPHPNVVAAAARALCAADCPPASPFRTPSVDSMPRVYAASGGSFTPPPPAFATQAGASQGSCRSRSQTVVRLSATELASIHAAPGAAAQPARHANAFSLNHTLLRAVLAQQRNELELRQCGRERADCAAGAGDDGVAVSVKTPVCSAVVEDTRLYLQNVHNPSHDVGLLMGRRGLGAPGLGGMGTRFGPATMGESSGAGGASGLPSPPQSLILATIQLDEGAALGLYVCFPTRLPAQLLEAVRGSCQELLNVALAEHVRGTLRDTALAPEYDTLKAVAPGSYAVVRRFLMGEDLIAGSVCGPPTLMSTAGAGAPSLTGFSDSLNPRWKAGGSVGALSSAMNTGGSAAESGVATRVHVGALEGVKGFATLRPGFISVDRARRPRGLLEHAVTACRAQVHVDDALDLLLVANSVADLGSTLCTGEGSMLTETHTSIVTVADVEPGSETVRQQMDLLVSSIQATIQTSAVGSEATGVFESDLRQLELQEVLGRGGGGVVLKGVINGTLAVAVKLMEVPEEEPQVADSTASSQQQQQQQHYSRQLQLRRGLLRNAMELATQSALSHPNIVQFYSTFNNVALRCRGGTQNAAELATDPQLLYLECVPPNTGEPCDEARVTCILAEYCDGGSLGNALTSRKFPRQQRQPASTRASPSHLPLPYDMRDVYRTLLDVALALRHLHSVHLVHRDLKPANLLLKLSPTDYRGFTVKLADFGFVTQLSETAEDGTRCVTTDQACGTVTHMAPESMMPKSKIDASVDVYGFGILMWELVAGGVRPFPQVHPDKIPRMVYKGARPSFAENVPHLYQDLACRCWHRQPSKRPRSAEVVNVIRTLLKAVS